MRSAPYVSGARGEATRKSVSWMDCLRGHAGRDASVIMIKSLDELNRKKFYVIRAGEKNIFAGSRPEAERRADVGMESGMQVYD